MFIYTNWECKLEENTDNLILDGEVLLNLSLKSETKEMLIKSDHK